MIIAELLCTFEFIWMSNPYAPGYGIPQAYAFNSYLTAIGGLFFKN